MDLGWGQGRGAGGGPSERLELQQVARALPSDQEGWVSGTLSRVQLPGPLSLHCSLLSHQRVLLSPHLAAPLA